MAEIKSIALTHKEVVEALIKHQGIHEGIWQLNIEFALGAANIQHRETNEVAPAAIIPIKSIGLQKVEAENPLAIDASKVNPKKK
jgi:hypothetical protein